MTPPTPSGPPDPTGLPTGLPAAPPLELLLYGLQSPINIGMILRTAEVYRIPVAVVDCHGVFDDPEKLATIGDFACGALQRRPPWRLADAAAVARLRAGRRLIASTLGPGARPLGELVLGPGDLVALGNEYDGLPEELAAAADARLHVPAPDGWLPKPPSRRPTDPTRTAPVARDGRPSLNVAVTAGILCHAAYAAGLRTRPGHSVHSARPAAGGP